LPHRLREGITAVVQPLLNNYQAPPKPHKDKDARSAGNHRRRRSPQEERLSAADVGCSKRRHTRPSPPFPRPASPQGLARAIGARRSTIGQRSRFFLSEGAAVEFSANRAAPFDHLSRCCSTATEPTEALGCPLPAFVPVAWITARFHSRPPEGLCRNDWKDWPAAALSVPSSLVYQDGARAGWVGQAWTSPDASSRGVQDTLDMAFKRFLARTSAPPRPLPRVVSLEVGTREGWLKLVLQAQRALCPQLRKLVLARARRFECLDLRTFSPRDVVARLAERFPDSVVFANQRGGGTFVGASPEHLLRLRGSTLHTRALAGTAGRERALELLECEKTRHEHQLVVEGIREALHSSSRRVWVAQRPRLRAVGNLAHLETPIRATLREGLSLLDLVGALHPTPALGGDPADHAQAWLAAEEGLVRGAYGAPFGWIGPTGEGDVLVGIRSALLRGGSALAYAGAGIVPASDPQAEWEETELKLEPMTWALGGAS
jgi:isochorismate synthase